MLHWAAAALVLLALPAVLPAAAAQGPLDPELAVAVEGVPTGLVQPGNDVRVFVVAVTARCDAVLRAFWPQDPMQPAYVRMTFEAANGLLIAGSSHVLIDSAACAGTATHVTVRQPYQLAIPRSAPGLEASSVGVTADFEAPLHDSVPTSPSPTADFVVTTDYSSVNRVSVVAKQVSCAAPCDADVVLAIENLGNARTQYRVEVASERSEGDWSVRLPEVLLLERPVGGEASVGTAVVKVAVPRGGGEAAYDFTVVPASADDPAKQGEPMTVHVWVRDASLGGQLVPGPAPVLVAFALLVAAFLARRRG